MPFIPLTTDEVSPFIVLPKQADEDFLRFIYELRARAAKFLGLLIIACYLFDFSITTQSASGKVTSEYISPRILAILSSCVLVVCAQSRSPTLLANAVHAWYIVNVYLRLVAPLQTAHGMFVHDSPAGPFLISSAVCLLGSVAMASTMHVRFPLVLALAVAELIGHVSLSSVTAATMRTEQKVWLGVLIVVGFAISMWTIYTVQLHTLLIYVWNKKYVSENAEKNAQKRLEELHRLHLANTLHDIGSPLQAFTNAVDELRDWQTKLPSQYLTHDFDQAITTMDASIEIMALARRRGIDCAKSLMLGVPLEPELSFVNVRSLITKSLVVISAVNRAGKNQVAISSTIHPAVPNLIWTDGAWLLEAMINYLSNAVKFTEEGWIRIHVYRTERYSSPNFRTAWDTKPTQRPIELLRFQVADTGSGVPENSMELLFRPFAKLEHNHPGTGLGLLSVKTKIEILGGNVGVEGNKPHGSTFWFEVPLITQETLCCKEGLAFAQLEVASQRPPSSDSGDLSAVQWALHAKGIDPTKIKVLIVEDEQMLLKFAMKVLKRIGFTVYGACDGVEALQLMKSQSFDVVLIDQNMPRKGGLETVRAFREWQQTQWERLPNEESTALVPPSDPLIFLMSASILEADRANARDLQVACFFDKPLHMDEVAAAIVTALVAQRAAATTSTHIASNDASSLLHSDTTIKSELPVSEHS